ncbi:hypothetical protein [Pseudomonas aeruginosa]|uniref:hypothetical protein n=1 Tax=Pseudomonas aeruginosa TaxID=287 RepID=UPI0011607C78|nr:hypothetical protein [Pseudomonas aeruginosa]
MHNRQIKRKRPTMQTAHDFYREGFFSIGPEHHLTSEERRVAIEGVIDDLRGVVKRQFPRTGILEYAVLKAHLIIEHAVTQYIRCNSITVIGLDELKFTFAQKVDIAYLMGFGTHDPTMLPVVERLNKVRNQVAHRFEMDRKQLDEMLRVGSGDYEDFSVLSDRERIRHLRQICYQVCAIVSGLIMGGYVMAIQE